MIDDKIANTILALLVDIFGMPAERFNYEIQDDWCFLLVLVEFEPATAKSEIQSRLLLAQRIMNKKIPDRHGAYSWMVNAMQEGVVVESVFGGDATSPSSGLL